MYILPPTQRYCTTSRKTVFLPLQSPFRVQEPPDLLQRLGLHLVGDHGCVCAREWKCVLER